MEKSMNPDTEKHLLIGYGCHGNQFPSRLIGHGIPEHDLIIVDTDPQKVASAKEAYPDATCTNQLNAVLGGPPIQAAWILVNTGLHLQVIKEVRNKVRNFFIEKPLVAPQHLEEAKGVLQGAKVVCGYLLRFSPASQLLREYLRNNLCIIDAVTSYYGKYRMFHHYTKIAGNRRATEGDLIDESTHGFDMVRHIASANQDLSSARMLHYNQTHHPFVNEDAQQRLNQIDGVTRLIPDNMTNWTIEWPHQAGAVTYSGISSYTLASTIRRFDFLFAEGKGAAMIDFDQKKDEDHLLIVKGNGESHTDLNFTTDKLGAQVAATLQYFRDGNKSALCTLEEAIEQTALLNQFN